MANYPVVWELVSGLKSRHAETRRKSIRELYHFAKTELHEMSPESLAQVLDDFNQQIHELISSYDSNEKKAAILTIVCLIGGDTETKIRTTRYADYLRNVFPSSDVSVLELAAKTMGRLAATLGVKRGEYVEVEIKRAFEWLTEERNEGKRLSAVLILKELAIAMPSYFYQHMDGFFDHIITAFRDPKEQIREAAAKALRAVLVVTSQREKPKQDKPSWYNKCYEKSCSMMSFSDPMNKEKGFNRDDNIHGALLILNELLRCSNASWETRYTKLMQKLESEQESSDDISSIGNKVHSSWSSQYFSYEGIPQTVLYQSAVCHQLVTQNYDTICKDVMTQQLSRSHQVHQMLLLILPRLAAFNKEVFRSYLNTVINYLTTSLDGREKDKIMAFTTLGLIAVAVECVGKDDLKRIIDKVKQTLPSRETPKKRCTSESPLFNCVTLLAHAMKEEVAKEVKELLEPMCATGLSLQLTTCFKELSQNVPSLKKEITDRLLNMLSIILRKKPCSVTGALNNAEQHYIALLEPQDASKLVLALRTLGSFEFEWQHILMSFIRRCTDHYLHSEQQDVRLEAIRTSAKLLVKAMEKLTQSHSKTLYIMIDEALDKLVAVGLTDFDNEVRYWVFQIFNDPIFDTFLAQEHHLNSLFVAVNDESIDVRELAMSTLGRLSSINPSYILPTLRQMYIQFLIEMQHSGLTRNKEQSTRMINNLILYAPTITRPYVDTILNVLVPKLKEEDNSPGVVISILKAIGDLSDVNGDGNVLNKWLPELLAVLVDFLSDSNPSEKRSVALWSFGQLISATGCVVTPYMEYPNLMNTLLSFLKAELHPRDRRETIRVLGLLGALDPYKHKVNRGLIDFQTVSILIPVEDDESVTEENLDTNVSEMLVNMSPVVLDEFYPAIVVTSLMRILRDPALSQHHTSVVHAITLIFHSLGIKCVPYISRVTPSLLYVIRNTESDNFREFLFNHLAQLISVVKIHIRQYLGKIFDIIKEFWTPKSQLQPTFILLVEHIAVALGAEFKVYLPKVLPQILRVLNNDTSKDRIITEKMLLAIQKFENNLDDVLQLVVPAITKLFDAKDAPITVAKLAMETIEHLSIYLNYKPFSSRIIHPLARVLDTNPSLRQTAMNTLCAVIIQLGRDYNDYIPAMEKLISKHKIQCQNYVVLITRLEVTSTLASDDNYVDETRYRLRNRTQDVVTSEPQTIKKLTVSAQSLRKYWAVNGRVSKEDWLEWLRRLSVGLLSESHSPAIRACSTLAHGYPQLARSLFTAAFMSCWTELGSAPRAELVSALEHALAAGAAPALPLAVLGLAEFMEHCDRGPLPIPPKLLGDRALSCRAYAKALFYKEEEYKSNPSPHVVEALIHINNKLQQKEAANGLLDKMMTEAHSDDSAVNMNVRWYEKLDNWDQALQLYNKKLKSEEQDPEAKLGQLRCLEALGEWGELHKSVAEQWDKLPEELKKRQAKIAAAASWGLQKWDAMRKYVEVIPENTQDGAFYRAILAIHDNQWAESRHFVDQARNLLDTELTAVAGESYQRAYAAIVNAQLLVELEEVVSYKLVEERRNVIRQAWWTRLQGGQRLVEDWRKMLQIRSLVLAPRDDFITWLKFASLCRKSGAIAQARNVLTTVLGSDPTLNPDLLLSMHEPRLVLTHSKNLWFSGEKRFAYDFLQRYVENAGSGDEDHCRLLARCHLKLGSWCEELQEINEISIPEILRNYVSATAFAPDWYKAWHAWASMNFETVLFYKQQDNTSESSLTGSSGDKKIRTEFLNQYTIAALEGFFKAISLSNGNTLQDTLRLLTLWFEYGHHPTIYEVLLEGIRKIEINIWLQVIPQLIARIDSPRVLVAKLVHSLLIDIGKFHPQSLVYPLTVSSNSSFAARKSAANQILKTMCSHSQNLVTQAAIISEELNRVAILWHDQWLIALDEASRLYYSEKDIKGMFKALEPMHAMIERGPQTLKEHSFVQMYGRDLREAQDCCHRYKETGDDMFLNEAWDLYYHVFRRLQAQFRSLTSLELQYVSPRLLNCRELELAVPGSHAPRLRLITIAHIHANLHVIKSKQRPRRLTIHGSDGKDYMFLLKGHEDLRQDERVMQLFGLVNTLLQAGESTYRHDLAIQRYAVVPLSTNSGLIGWVPHCDTLYNLISDYREKKPNKIALNKEQQIMTRSASEFHKLSLMQKVEVFEHTLAETPGNDLARLLWLKSPSAEAWFERRNNYTRSLAVMSMVGYILGLGDRHPSNIMLHRVTGKVLHIDFGDCFEVTLTRERFPEKIPFRLTRMLINAMEVTGIEGTYRRTSEAVMHVLRAHRDSVLAVLEAFVYDPLLTWRLVETGRRSVCDASLASDAATSPSDLPSRSRHCLHPDDSVQAPAEVNKRALEIVSRIRDKLTGRDFPGVEETVSVARQVDLLIRQATNNENLCQCYIGWCPFW